MTGNTEIEQLKAFMLKGLVLKNNMYKTESSFSKIIFIDDMNMCSKDEFGVKQPHEFLRQWSDYEGWHNTTTKAFNRVRGI
jgi:hypothetical protein